MAVCTFFGHRDTSEIIIPKLKACIVSLIENYGVVDFLVGNNGNFDRIVKVVLNELRETYPQINYRIALAYIPKAKSEFDSYDYSDTVYLEGLEKVPLKYAILKRNELMLNKAEYVVTYVKRKWGGAAAFAEKARIKGKHIINLAEK